MTSLLLTLPVIIPLFTACLLFFVRSHKTSLSALAIVASLVNVIVSGQLMLTVIEQGPFSVAFGDWDAPFGIVFVADLLGAAMVLITSIIALAISIYSTADLKNKSSYPLYQLFTQVLIAGVIGAFLTGDVFNLYVWFEVMLIASFGLMILDADKRQIDGAVKYVALNLISTLFFLLAIGLLYGTTGTLNMADLHAKIPLVDSALMMVIACLFLFGFAIKSALFPVFAWLPASYHTMPSAVVALFAALLTKVGVYALIRFFTLLFPLEQTSFQPLLIVIAGLTMLTGVLGAASQFSIKKILSFHIISQIGYMVMGLALFTPLALAGAIFYLIHHIIVKANLFLVGGVISRVYGSDTLKNIGGAYKAMPFLSFLFLIPAFSLAGFPPLSGFWGKFLVIKASLQLEHYLLAGTALFVGLLTIFSMTKIWGEAFWKPSPNKGSSETLPLSHLDKVLYYSPIVLLCVITLIIGLAAEPFFVIAEQAAQQLLNPSAYINAVLGEQL